MSNWILKRNDTKEALELHRQYWWRDEHEWTSLAQSAPVYTLTGSMEIQQGTKKAGRPITLDSTYARIKRKDLKTLQSWAEVPELQMTLTHPLGKEYDVIFRRPAISDIADILVMRPSDESPDDLFKANLCFITV